MVFHHGPVHRPVRPATLDDLPAVAAVYAPYVERTVTTFDEEIPDLDTWQAKLAALTAGALPFLVAELDGRVAGFAYASPWRGAKAAYRRTVENTVYLAEDAAGRGLGGALLTRLLDECRAAGFEQVVAVIADPERNPASVALHLRAGFREVGVLRGVGRKHGRVLDTALYQRSLDDEGIR